LFCSLCPGKSIYEDFVANSRFNNVRGKAIACHPLPA
jgi:hypothetical protein